MASGGAEESAEERYDGQLLAVCYWGGRGLEKGYMAAVQRSRRWVVTNARGWMTSSAMLVGVPRV